MADAPRHVAIKEVHASSQAGDLIRLLVIYHDGTEGTVTLPANLVGAFIERLHQATLGSFRGSSVPLIEALQVGAARGPGDKVHLRLKTAQAHEVECVFSRSQIEWLVENLGNLDALAITKEGSLN